MSYKVVTDVMGVSEVLNMGDDSEGVADESDCEDTEDTGVSTDRELAMLSAEQAKEKEKVKGKGKAKKPASAAKQAKEAKAAAVAAIKRREEEERVLENDKSIDSLEEREAIWNPKCEDNKVRELREAQYLSLAGSMGGQSAGWTGKFLNSSSINYSQTNPNGTISDL